MLTREEKALRKLLQFWSLLFGVGALLFAFASGEVLKDLNWAAAQVAPGFSSLPLSVERFWLALAVSLMVTITALCYGAQRDIKRRKDWVIFLLISKATSTLFFTLYFFIDQRSLPYLFGTLIDGSIFMITLIFYSRALRSSQLLP